MDVVRLHLLCHTGSEITRRIGKNNLKGFSMLRVSVTYVL